jgi:ATP-binding cassette subfamily F protein 1
MIFNEEVTIKLGNKLIVNDSKITIDNTTKYCIIGPNGIGKTTIMNHIYEKIKDNTFVLYITQAESIDDSCNVFEYMLKSNEKLYKNFTRLEELQNLINNENSDNGDAILEEYNLLSEEIKSENFGKYKSKILKILHGLGFFDLQKKINLLSGGQHTKLALCKALLLEPELLLLDEPTNHLDLNNILWLENYLANYKKSLILISHNIDFFNTICDKIFYFFNMDPQNPQLHSCKGGYSNFTSVFEQGKKDYIKEYEKYSKRIVELKKKNDKSELEKYMQKTCINRPIKDYEIVIKFNKVPLLSSNEYSNIISFNNINFSYDGIKNTLENINIGISMKSRYILVGDNGSGKSTFFNLCVKKLSQSSGDIVFDNRIRIGYFNQHSITQLPENITPIHYLQSIDNNLDQQSCRAILSKVGFKKMYEGDNFDVGKLLISELSGGQKVKMVLCGIMIKNPHVILFDEPTNHLDIYSINEFIDSINEYNGGIVIITHDKYIIENINDYKLLVMENKTITEYNCGFEKYCEKFIFDD